MDKLTKEELEEMWWIYHYEANGDSLNIESTEMCFSISAFYKQRYGAVAHEDWIIRRLK